MTSRLTDPNPSFFALACLMLVLTFSCAPKDIYEGVYKAEGGTSQKYCNSQIELMDKGLAVWRVPDDEVSFRWDIKDSQLWLSSQSGGIVIGKIQGDTIEVKLPGIDATCCFKKAPIE